MNANKCSRDIRIAEQAFWNLGRENTYAGEDLHKHSLRQLSLVYHLIHYRVDRPLQEGKYWPECLKLLREELHSALSAQKIPESWLKAFLPERKSGQERAAPELNASLHPLLTAVREEIEKILKKLGEIESQAQKFWSPYRKRRYVKGELGMIGHWAIKRARESIKIINHNVVPLVSRPRQDAGTRNNGSRKAARCAAL